MYYAYCAADRTEESLSEALVEQCLLDYAKKLGVTYEAVLHDALGNKIHWERRQLKALLTHFTDEDHMVVYEASDLACSSLQVLEILDAMSTRGVTLHLVKYQQIFSPGKIYDTAKFIHLFKHIEGEFVTKRTTEALARRRAAGLPLGRPKGRKNKEKKLDKFRAEIKKYLLLDINKASIAKLVGCHAQTLYSYLEETHLVEEVAEEKQRASAVSERGDLDTAGTEDKVEVSKN